MGKLVVKIVVIILIIGLIALVGYFGHKTYKEKFGKKIEVGSIDKDDVLELSAFRKANRSIEKKIKELDVEYAKKAEGATQEQQEELFRSYQSEVEAIKSGEVKPLLDKVQASIALVAIEKKMKVVLDKKIVVCGAVDITEEVKDKFRSSEELETPEENIGLESQIGYFDQEVVRSLKMFRDVDNEFFQWYSKLKTEVEKKVQDLPEDERQKFFNEYNAKFMKRREEMYLPLLQKVEKTVEEVAKEKSLVLVLDKQYVMYGGQNLTDAVVDKFQDDKE